MRSILLIPDGIRRYAASRSRPLEACYRSAGLKLLRFSARLLQDFHIVGVYPLAAYNLQRKADQRSALLSGGLWALMHIPELIPSNMRIVFIGDIDALIEVHKGYGEVVERHEVNPHKTGITLNTRGTLIIYLCFDSLNFIREATMAWPSAKQLRENLPNWKHVIRTGCTPNATRLSAVFLGTEDARIASSRRLFNNIRYVDVQRIIEHQKRAASNGR